MRLKEIVIKSTLQVYQDINEIPIDILQLMKKAISARKKAYAPYSNFNVGTALLLDNGKVITGSNQENASYPSGLCAERTAIFYAGAKFPEAKVLKMAISAASQIQPTNSPVPPCGACRQSIAEYEVKQNTPIEIYFMGETGQVVKSQSLSNLLPLMFDKSML